jgi:hypothetical protein
MSVKNQMTSCAISELAMIFDSENANLLKDTSEAL